MEDSPAREPATGKARRWSSLRTYTPASKVVSAGAAGSSSPDSPQMQNAARRPSASASHAHYSPYSKSKPLRPPSSRAADSGELEALESGITGGTRSPRPQRTPAGKKGAGPTQTPGTLKRFGTWVMSFRGGGAKAEADMEQGDVSFDEAEAPAAQAGEDSREQARLPPSNLRHSVTMPSNLSSHLQAAAPRDDHVVTSSVKHKAPPPPLTLNGFAPHPQPSLALNPFTKLKSAHSTLQLPSGSRSFRPPSPDRILIPGSSSSGALASRSRVPSPLAAAGGSASGLRGASPVGRTESVGDTLMRSQSPVRAPGSLLGAYREPGSGSGGLPNSSSASSVLVTAPARGGSPFRSGGRSAGSPFRTGSPFQSAQNRALAGRRGLSSSASLPFLASGGFEGPVSKRRAISPLGRAVSSALLDDGGRVDPRFGSPVGSVGAGMKRGYRDMSISPPRASGSSVFGASGSVVGGSPGKRDKVFTTEYGFLTSEELASKRAQEEMARREREGRPLPTNQAEKILEALEASQGTVGKARRMMSYTSVPVPAPSREPISAMSAFEEYQVLNAPDYKPRKAVAPATRNEERRKMEQIEARKGQLRRENARSVAEAAARERREEERRLRSEMAAAAEMEARAKAADEDMEGDDTVIPASPPPRRSSRRSRSVSVDPTAVVVKSPGKGKGRGKAASRSVSVVDDEPMEEEPPARRTRASAKKPAPPPSTATNKRRTTRAATKSPEPEALPPQSPVNKPLPRAIRPRTRSASVDPEPKTPSAKAKGTPTAQRKRLKSPTPIAEEPTPTIEEVAKSPTPPAHPSVTFAREDSAFVKSRSTSLRPGRTFSSRRHASARVFSAREEDLPSDEEEANPAFDKIKIDLSQVVFPSGFKSTAAPTVDPPTVSGTPTPQALTPALEQKKASPITDKALSGFPAFPQSKPPAASSGFSFEKSKEAPATAAGGFSFAGSSGTTTPAFSFSKPADASAAPAPSIFASQPKETSAPPAPSPFSFAKPAESAAPSATPTASSSFFSAPPASSAPTSSTPAAATPSFDFGRNPKDAQPPNFFKIKPAADVAPSTSASIEKSASADNPTSSGMVNGFGTSSTEAPKSTPFSFGATSAANDKQAEPAKSPFGTAAAPKSPFGAPESVKSPFGAPTASAAPAAFTWGKPAEPSVNSTSTSTSPFGATASTFSSATAPATSGFGGFGAPSAPSDAPKPAGNPFGGFGAQTATSTASPSPFESPATDKAAIPNPFGGTASSFGAFKPPTLSEAPASAFGFGAPATPAAATVNGNSGMSGTNGASPFNIDASKPTTFAFGSTPASGSAPFVFGSGSNGASAPSMAATQSAPGFGGASTGGFGNAAAAAPASSGGFSFGGGGAAASPFSGGTNGFAAQPAQQQAAFSFGAPSTPSATPAASPFGNPPGQDGANASPGFAMGSYTAPTDSAGRQVRRLPRRKK